MTRCSIDQAVKARRVRFNASTRLNIAWPMDLRDFRFAACRAVEFSAPFGKAAPAIGDRKII
jgi:hypothetical protein